MDEGTTDDASGVEESARWTTAMRDAFFDRLATTGDVAGAAAAIGVPVARVHRRRRTNKAFATQWDGAIRAGYQLIETRLIGAVLAAGAPPAGAGVETAAYPWDRAVRLLALNASRRPERGGAKRPATKAARRDETDTVILARLAALAAARPVATTRDRSRGKERG